PTGLPTSAPTEFRDGSKSAGILSNPPAVACTGPNIAFVEVLLPERATPIQPRTGHKMTNAGPILDSPNASELAIPVKTNVYASPKMKKPTSSAPHICRNVFRKDRKSTRLNSSH